MNFNQWLVIVPARLKSERLPKKPLVDLAGKPLVVRVYENLTPLIQLGAQVIIALDSPKTAQVCEDSGIPFVMTDEGLPSGTDRCQEAAKLFPDKSFILNVQGDEPFINPDDLLKLMSHLQSSKDPMGTLGYRNTDWHQFNDPNVVKIVLNNHSQAIYFSRAPIPFDRDGHRQNRTQVNFWQHLGVYAFTRDALESFCKLQPSSLEQIEKLEQLRAVSAGWTIQVVEASSKSLGIDTPEDLERARKHFHG